MAATRTARPQLVAAILLNGVPDAKAREAAQAPLKSTGLPVLTASLPTSRAYKAAYTEGTGVTALAVEGRDSAANAADAVGDVANELLALKERRGLHVAP